MRAAATLSKWSSFQSEDELVLQTQELLSHSVSAEGLVCVTSLPGVTSNALDFCFEACKANPSNVSLPLPRSQ